MSALDEDIEIHPYRMGNIYSAIQAKTARFARENPTCDLVRLAMFSPTG